MAAATPSISLDDAYGRVRQWYQTNYEHLLKTDGGDVSYRQRSVELIRHLPEAKDASELEKRAVMAEVIAGLLEWGYGENDGVRTMSEYAHAATSPFGGYVLDERETLQLRDSRLWPYLGINPGANPPKRRANSTIEDRPASAPPSSPSQFDFSETVTAVLSQARELAARSGRKGVTSSCLLFALAESSGPERNTSRFVRDALDRKGTYEQAFQTFLSDSSGSPRQSASDAGSLGKTSLNVQKILEQAQGIAVRVCAGKREIHARHLFAALLVVPETESTLIARKRLAREGIDLTQLCAEFRIFLRTSVPSDNQTEWDAILIARGNGDAHTAAETPTPESSETAGISFQQGTPGYTSEYCGVGGTGAVPDHLGVESLACRLAELMALSETRLPLAIGLFGNWGSGKSHFMNLMDRHMKKLAAEGSNASGAENPSPWCREIVPIYFNAWHYSDTNLWASLVAEVFDGLFAHLRPRGDDLGVMRSKLREAGGVAARAEEEVKEAKETVRRATESLQRARAEKEGARQIVRSLLDGLATLIPEVNTPQNRKQVAELLGVRAEDATLSQVVEKRRQLISFAGRTRELWRRVTARQGRAVRFAWLAGAVAAVGLLRIAGGLIPEIETFLSRISPWVQSAVAAIGSLMLWLTPAFRRVNDALDQLENWQTRAEAAQRAIPEKPAMIAAQQRLAEAEARAAAAEAKLSAARDTEIQLSMAIDELRPEIRLSRFIDARARSADYRGQLGLVSLARRDFQELSNIFADAKALKKKVQEQPGEAERLEKLSASVDRIVLFVDDLDRCEPEKVVDVLQAVHLLLAYPLFGVVVGVDQRCLKQSLRIRFKSLLTPDRGTGAAGGEAGTADEDEIPATPLDYLEKIFHVPFHLPAMNKTGFGNLVEKLTEPFPNGRANEQTEMGTAAFQPPSGTSQSVSPVENTDQSPANDASSNAVSAGAGAVRLPSENPRTAEDSLRVVGSVPLVRWERDALKEYHSLIHTPRAATRLLNTYRLVRAGVSAEEWDGFRGDSGGGQEARLAMLLLAVAAGYPAIAREWFRELRNHSAGAVREQGAGASAAEWKKFDDLYTETSRRVASPNSSELIGKWLDRVERFCF